MELNFVKTGLKFKFEVNPQSFSHELCLYITRFACHRPCMDGSLVPTLHTPRERVGSGTRLHGWVSNNLVFPNDARHFTFESL